MMAVIALLFHLLELLSVLFCLPSTSIALIKQDNETDQSALLAMKSYVRDPSDLIRKDWNATIPVCKWIGVTCSSRHQRVVLLNLSYIGLEGRLAPEVGNLTFLKLIDLRGNSFQGSLTQEMMHLRRLKYMNLMYNKFSGELPSWLGSLPNLVEIRFSNNSFTGAIPPSLFNSSKLEYLSIPFNGLQGNIPQEIGTNVNLKYVNMEGNQLSGSIPQSLLNLTSLELFGFTFNRSSGELPLNICSKLPKLQGVYLSLNKLSGRLESSFDNCSQLEAVSLSTNNFSGPIPRGLANLTTLRNVWLGQNKFTGEIPSEIGNMLNVEILMMGENALTDDGRVCDFGIAKLFAGAESMAQTKTLATIGYIAPEYGSEGIVSPSCDVYSFGILLMETFSRKKPTHEMFTEDWGLRVDSWFIAKFINRFRRPEPDHFPRPKFKHDRAMYFKYHGIGPSMHGQIIDGED